MRKFTLSAQFIIFYCIILLLNTFHFIVLFIAFSKYLLKNQFFKDQCLEQTVSLRNISVCCFFSNPGPTPSTNRLNNGKNLIIRSSVTNDGYIRHCISLIRHQRQMYTSYVWFIFLDFGGWKQFF